MTKFIEVTSLAKGRKYNLPINEFLHHYEPVDERMGGSFVEYMGCVGFAEGSKISTKYGVIFHVKETYKEVKQLIQVTQSN